MVNDNEKLSRSSLTEPNKPDPSDLNFECPDEIPRTFKQKLIRSGPRLAGTAVVVLRIYEGATLTSCTFIFPNSGTLDCSKGF